MILLLIVAVLLLSGCGGGGGHEVVAPVVQAIAATRADLLFCYFGVSTDRQLRDTADHVNCALIMAWNEPQWDANRSAVGDRVIQQVQDAVFLGIDKIILGIDFLLFDSHYQYRNNLDDLHTFVFQLTARGLWKNVVALYPLDEPDLNNISDAQMSEINTALKTFGRPLATIYTDRGGWPGIATFDWVGFDKYGVDYRGNGTLADLYAHLHPEQRVLMVAGGANPWRDNVRPVLAYANGDPRVVGIVAFIYADHYAGTDYSGIVSNGMLPEYAEVGAAIKKAGST